MADEPPTHSGKIVRGSCIEQLVQPAANLKANRAKAHQRAAQEDPQGIDPWLQPVRETIQNCGVPLEVFRDAFLAVFTSGKYMRTFEEVGLVPINAQRTIDLLGVRHQTLPQPHQPEAPPNT